MFRLSIFLTACFIIMPICAYAGTESSLAVGAISCSFSDWVNAQPDNKPVNDAAEKMLIREQWERNIGIDIFYPYFKAKEVEKKVSEKASIRIFKVRGKPEFKTNEAKYIFSIKF